MDKKMLQDVISAYGPTGREERAAEVIRSYVAPYADDVYTDTLGNLIAVKKGSSGKRVMLAAHMDQIGFIVVDIDDKGFLRVSNVGGIPVVTAVGCNVVFENGVNGVIFRDTKDVEVGSVKMPNLFIDIGAYSKEEAEAMVSVGDVAVYAHRFVEMGEKLASTYMDDRVSCAVVIEAMKEMKSEHDVYAVFTVQEEVGCRGARTAAYAIEPDYAIAVDVTGVGDIPECNRMSVALGNGPTVKMMDSSVIVPVEMRNFIRAAAEKANIPYQLEVLRGGGTDTGVIQTTRSGIVAGCISIPTRYIHNPIETVSSRDLDNTVKLLVACLAEKAVPEK